MTVKKAQASSSRADAPDEFPALRAFLSGYLHEDFVVEHGTPEGALRAFMCDAGAGARRALGAEVARFVDKARGRPWSQVRRQFIQLGGAWTPPSRAAVDALFAALSRGQMGVR